MSWTDCLDSILPRLPGKTDKEAATVILKSVQKAVQAGDKWTSDLKTIRAGDQKTAACDKMKRNKCRMKNSLARHICRVLKEIHPDIGFPNKVKCIVNFFVHDMIYTINDSRRQLLVCDFVYQIFLDPTAFIQ